MFYLADKTEDLSPDIVSQISRDCPRREGTGLDMQDFCNKDQVVRISKDYC